MSQNLTPFLPGKVHGEKDPHQHGHHAQRNERRDARDKDLPSEQTGAAPGHERTNAKNATKAKFAAGGTCGRQGTLGGRRRGGPSSCHRPITRTREGVPACHLENAEQPGTGHRSIPLESKKRGPLPPSPPRASTKPARSVRNARASSGGRRTRRGTRWRFRWRNLAAVKGGGS